MRCLYYLNTPKLLGYLGLLPFLALILLLLLEPHHQAFYRGALISYSAVILTFVGALFWSFAMQMHSLNQQTRRSLYIWSVLPSLVGWLALLLQGLSNNLEPFIMIVLAFFFILALWRDVLLVKVAALPEWYLPLRKTLTCVVVGCLVLAVFS
jgi:hypothetical protein